MEMLSPFSFRHIKTINEQPNKTIFAIVRSLLLEYTNVTPYTYILGNKYMRHTMFVEIILRLRLCFCAKTSYFT